MNIVSISEYLERPVYHGSANFDILEIEPTVDEWIVGSKIAETKSHQEEVVENVEDIEPDFELEEVGFEAPEKDDKDDMEEVDFESPQKADEKTGGVTKVASEHTKQVQPTPAVDDNVEVDASEVVFSSANKFAELNELLKM